MGNIVRRIVGSCCRTVCAGRAWCRAAACLPVLAALSIVGGVGRASVSARIARRPVLASRLLHAALLHPSRLRAVACSIGEPTAYHAAQHAAYQGKGACQSNELLLRFRSGSFLLDRAVLGGRCAACIGCLGRPLLLCAVCLRSRMRTCVEARRFLRGVEHRVLMRCACLVCRAVRVGTVVCVHCSYPFALKMAGRKASNGAPPKVFGGSFLLGIFGRFCARCFAGLVVPLQWAFLGVGRQT